MKEIKKIKVLSFAKFQAALMFLLAIIMIVFVLIFGGILSSFSGMAMLGLFQISGLAFITFPIGYAIFGFIAGAIGALLYNLTAKIIGGIKIELVDSTNNKPIITNK